jgi:hypothetical protein
LRSNKQEVSLGLNAQRDKCTKFLPTTHIAGFWFMHREINAQSVLEENDYVLIEVVLYNKLIEVVLYNKEH